MRLNFTRNGKKNGMGKLRSLADFFFPYVKNGECEFVREEAFTFADTNGNLYREFSTFRAFVVHYAYEAWGWVKKLASVRVVALEIQGNGMKFPIGYSFAVAFDTADHAKTAVDGTSLSFNHTCTGSNLVLYAPCNLENVNNSDVFSGNQTYNSVAMTSFATIGGTINTFWKGFYLINPSTGSQSVAFTTSANRQISAFTVSYSGASQTTQPDGSNTGNTVATTMDVAVTVTASNCWGVIVADTSQNQISGGTNTTTRDQFANGVGIGFCDSNATIGTGSITLGVTADSLGTITGIAWSIPPAPATSSGMNNILTMGV